VCACKYLHIEIWKYRCEYVQIYQVIHKYIHLTTCEYAYLNICTHMSPHVKLIYTETPCFVKNKWTQKITKNTGKYTLTRATKVTISNFRGWRCQKKPRFARGFWRESRKQRMRTAVPSYQIRPSSQRKREGTWDFCTVFVALRGQGLGERQRRTAWWARHRKDTANDHLVQTCLY